MGGLLSKKKRDSGKNVKMKAGKNNPRNVGSTMSLNEDSIGVSATPNPYIKNNTARQQNRKISDPGLSSGSATTVIRPVPPTPSKPKLPVVKAMYDYTARYQDDMSFQKGDRMEIVSKGDNDNWWLVRKIGTKEEAYVPSNYIVVDDNSIETQEWWFGSDRREANKQLMLPGNPIGTFLIRNSKEKNAYALSFLDRDEKDDFVIRHYLIRKMDNGGCYIQTRKTFTDLFELVAFYSGENSGLRRCLTQPCPKQALAVPFKDLEVKRTDIVIGERLGAGNFGEVHAGTFRNVVDVAVKSLKQGAMTNQQFLEEAEFMHRLRHPKLVQLMGVCTQGLPLWIITERMAHGALIDYLRKDMGKAIQFPTIIDMAAQISDGMSYLETQNFIHRDLRAANILVAENFVVKVADFGLARMLDGIYVGEDDVYSGNEHTKFPIKWTAPEAATEYKFSIKSDVWSFGILLYELVTYGRIPYPDMDNSTTIGRVIKGYRMLKPMGENICCPEELYEIMLQCWEAKPEKRPTFEHLKTVFEDFQVSTERSYTQDDA